jgi:hypothetical protein
MTSSRIVEIKLGAEKPLKPEEVKRCELKPPMETKRTARICCGGCVTTGAITSLFRVMEERVSTLVCRSECIRGIKRKDYKEVSPEPKDYGGVTILMIVVRARGRPPEGRTMTSTIWKWCPGRRLPKALMEAVTPMTTARMTATSGDDPGDVDPFGIHPLCCAACRHSISEFYSSVDECFQAMEAMMWHMEDLERVVEDDYKFLNRNVRSCSAWWET